MSDATLAFRTVLVTGATSRIGHETARQLAERGATVPLHGPSHSDAGSPLPCGPLAPQVRERRAPGGAGSTRTSGLDGSLTPPTD